MSYDAEAQIRWGLDYIQRTYKPRGWRLWLWRFLHPARAWKAWQSRRGWRP